MPIHPCILSFVWIRPERVVERCLLVTAIFSPTSVSRDRDPRQLFWRDFTRPRDQNLFFLVDMLSIFYWLYQFCNTYVQSWETSISFWCITPFIKTWLNFQFHIFRFFLIIFKNFYSYSISTVLNFKVHIFWEGRTILRIYEFYGE